MVELAIAGHPAFGVSSIELNREGPSYSVDTLAELARQNPGAELFFLMGGDSLADLPLWYQPTRIASLATLVVAARPGFARPDAGPLENVIGKAGTERLLEHIVEIPLVHISSSDIRARVANGKSMRYLVPRAVECFIETHGLYKG